MSSVSATCGAEKHFHILAIKLEYAVFVDGRLKFTDLGYSIAYNTKKGKLTNEEREAKPEMMKLKALLVSCKDSIIHSAASFWVQCMEEKRTLTYIVSAMDYFHIRQSDVQWAIKQTKVSFPKCWDQLALFWHEMENVHLSFRFQPTVFVKAEQFVDNIFRDDVDASAVPCDDDVDEVVKVGDVTMERCRMTSLERKKFQNIFETVNLQLRTQLDRYDIAIATKNWNMVGGVQKRFWNTLDFFRLQIVQTLDYAGKSCKPTRQFCVKKTLSPRDKLEKYVSWILTLKNDLNLAETLRPKDEKGIVMSAFVSINFVEDLIHELLPFARKACGEPSEWVAQMATKTESGSTNWGDLMDEADPFVEDEGDADLGEDVPVTEQNLVFTDARGVVEDTTFETGDCITIEDKTSSATDRPWDLQMMSERPWLTYTTTWTKTMTAGSSLFQTIVPRGLVDDTACASAFVTFANQFTFLNSGFEVRFQVNGTKFHQGRIICAFVPFISLVQSHSYSIDNLVTCPHVILDASISNSGILTIPFAHMFSNFLLRISEKYPDWISPLQYLGVLTVRVFNQLAASDTTTSDLTVNIYTRMLKPKFAVMLPAVTNGTVNAGVKALASQLWNNNASYPIPPTAPIGCGENTFHAQSGLIKTAASTVGNVAGSVGAALQGIGRFAEDFAGNCDKPQLPAPPDPIVLRVAPNLAPGDGLDLSQRLSLYPDSYTMTTSDQTASVASDMSLRALCETYSRVGTFPWAVADGSNKLLQNFPLCPTLCKYVAAVGTGQNLDIQYIPTCLAYCSRPFMFWRGSLKIKLQIVSTQMHSGRLGITLYYHGDRMTQAATSSKCRMYQPTVIWDIQEKKEIEIEVPYNAIMPWLRCDKFVYAFNQVASGDGPPGVCEPDTGTVGMAYSSLFSLSVMSRLVCPSNVPQNVEINAFIAAGPDFELCNPSIINLCTGQYSSNQNMDLSVMTLQEANECCFHAQAGDGTVSKTAPSKGTTKAKMAPPKAVQKNVTTRETKSKVVTPQPRVEKPAISNMPETHMDLKAVLRRFYQVLSVKNTVAISAGWHRFQIAVAPYTKSDLTDATQYEVDTNMDPISWFSQLYTFWRGSMRYKIINPTKGGIMFVTYHPHVATTHNIDVSYSQTYPDVMESCNTGVVLVAGSAAAVVEVEVPFFSRYRMLQCSVDGTGDLVSNAGSLVIWIETLEDIPANSETFHVPIMKSVGDDFVFSLKRMPPCMKFLGYVDSPPNPLYDWDKWCGAEWQRRLNDKAPYFNKTQMLATGQCVPQAEPKQWYAQADDVEVVEVSESQDPVDVVLKSFVTSQSKFDRTCDRLADLADHMKLGFPSFIDATDKVASMADSVTEAVEGKIPWSKLMSIGVTLHDLFITEDWSSRFGKIIVLSSLLGFEAETMISAMSHVLGFGQESQIQVKNDFKAQMGWGAISEKLSASTDWFKDLVSGIGAAVFSTITGVLPSLDSIGPFVTRAMSALRNAHFIGQGLRGIECVWRWISNVITWAYEWAIGTKAPGFFTWHYLNLTSDKIGKWLSEVPQFYGEECMQRLVWDDEEMFRMYKFYDEGMDYVRELSKDKSMALTSFVRMAMSKLDNTVQEFQKSHCGPTVRVDPYCVAWFGAAGVGKSAGMLRMMHEVMDEMQYPRSNRVYHRNDNDQYWSNYTFQTSVFIDDFYSRTDSEVVKEFITLKSNCAYPLNMASVEEKGKMFKSHMIWMTTNTAYPRPNEVVHNQALLRRRNMLMRVRRTPETSPDDLDSYRFDICDANRDVVLVANMTWVEAKNRIIADMSNYLDQQKTLVLDIVKRGEMYVSPNLARDLLRGQHQETFSKEVDKLVVQDPVSGTTIKFGDYRTAIGFEAQANETPDTTKDALDWLNGSFFRAAKTICDSSDAQQTTVMRAVAHTVSRYKQSLSTLMRETMEHEGGAVKVVDAEFCEHVDVVDGKIVLKQGAPSSIEVLLELLLGEMDMSSLVKLVQPFKVVIATKVEGWYQKWKTRIEVALMDAKTQMGSWLKEHPRIATAIKMVGSLVGVFTGMKMFAFLAPNLYKAMELKIVKWFGLESEETRFGAMKHFLSSGMNEALTKEAVIDYGNVYVQPPLLKLYDRLKARFGWSQEQAQAVVAEFEGQSLYDAHNFTKAPVKVPVVTMHNATAQSDLLVEQLETRILPGNGMVVSFSWLEGDERRTLEVRGLAIGGRDVMLPKHFVQRIPMGTKFVVRRRGKPDLEVFMVEGMAKHVSDLDLTIIKMPVAFGSQKRITQHFVGEGELGFQSVPITFNCYSVSELTHSVVSVATASSLRSYVSGGVEICNQVGWRYPIATRSGDCGAILVAHDTRLKGRIIGFHVAGTGDEGFSLVVSKEMLEGFGYDMNDKMVAQAEQLVENIVPPRIGIHGNFTVFGTVPNTKAVSVPRKTDIKPSCIFEKVRAHVTEPSVLVPGDPRNTSGETPLQKAVLKYGVPPKPINPYVMDMAMYDMLEEIMQWRVPFPKRLLNDQEVILGDESVEYLDRMNMHTSPGYPYVLSKTGKGKAYLFDVDQGRVVSEQLQARLDEREHLAKHGLRPLSIWIDCLKDERRPLAKIADGKTRLFTIPPVDFTMMVRKYFMSFVVAFYANHNHSFSAVGIDPYSKEWTHLYYDLVSVSTRVVAGDYGTFDGMMLPGVIERMAQMINLWFQTENPLDDFVRLLLMDEVVHTMQLCLNVLYMSHQGNPSGNPITVVLNTMVNEFYVRCAWVEIMLERCPKHASMEFFNRFVRRKIYGDDIVMSVAHEVENFFNQNTLTEKMAEWGLKFTDEVKSGEETLPLRDIRDVTFLKNGFAATDCGLVKATMSKDTIFELTNWIRRSDNDALATRDNCISALRFAYFWGREFFDELLLKINLAFREVGMRAIIDSYDIHDIAFLFEN